MHSRNPCLPGIQLSPQTVRPGTGVELPGQPAPLAAEMAGPVDTYDMTQLSTALNTPQAHSLTGASVPSEQFECTTLE